jgi:hypothetical protein
MIREAERHPGYECEWCGSWNTVILHVESSDGYANLLAHSLDGDIGSTSITACRDCGKVGGIRK